MSDLANLQKRVGEAVDKLRLSESQRRQHNDSLGRLLNDLEIKFEARKFELDHCQDRIRQLEESNRVLTGLVGDLVDIVERTADQTGEDPVYRTTAAASEIITRFVPDAPANDVRDESAAEDAAFEPVSLVSAYGTTAARYEDVGSDDLLAEELYERSEGAPDFPRLVHDAAALARGEAPHVETTVSADAEPVAGDESEPADSGLDIKEILARLEIAAERSQLRAEAAATADRADLDRAATA